MSVTKEGFDTATIKEVRIVIDQKQLVNFQLKVGAVATVETVTAAPTMLQTQSSETGEVIQSHEILDLPLLGRNFYALTALTAGVTQQGGSINTFNFQANGQREYANSIQIDGVESTTNRTQDITATPSVDSVEEFKVSTSSFQPSSAVPRAQTYRFRPRVEPITGTETFTSSFAPTSQPPGTMVFSA